MAGYSGEESGMFGTQKKAECKFSIKQDGPWASGEVVQNRMAVTGRPYRGRHAGEPQRATKSHNKRQNGDSR